MQVISATPSIHYKSMYSGITRIISAEGAINLWRGMSSVVVGAGTPNAYTFLVEYVELTTHTGPAHAVYFATYEAVKHAMGGNELGKYHIIAAGWLCIRH